MTDNRFVIFPIIVILSLIAIRISKPYILQVRLGWREISFLDMLLLRYFLKYLQ